MFYSVGFIVLFLLDVVSLVCFALDKRQDRYWREFLQKSPVGAVSY